jgi:hypothetical protein
MRFKEFFYNLIKENPDDAQFMIDNEEYYTNFAKPKYDPQTLIITDTSVISTPSKNFYHEPMMYEILKSVNKNIPVSQMFDIVGELSDEDLKILITQGIKGRESLFNFTKNISLARTWHIKEKDAYAVSFWRTTQVSLQNKKMLYEYFMFKNIPIENVFVETRYNTKSFIEFLSNNKTQKVTSQEREEEKIIHLLPSDQKRRALLAAGVKPKAVIPIQQKYDREER